MIAMKKILLLVIGVTGFIFEGWAQEWSLPIDSVSNKITYHVWGNSNLSKNELYLKSKDWATTVFVNYNDVVLMDDKDLGKLRINGAANIGNDYDFGLKYNILIACSEGKYNFTLSDINRYYFGSRTFAAELDYERLLEHKETIQRLNETPKTLWTRNEKRDYPVILRVIPKWERESEKINEAIIGIVENYRKFMEGN